MSAAAMKPPPIALAVLALAAVYYFTRRNTSGGALSAANPALSVRQPGGSLGRFFSPYQGGAPVRRTSPAQAQQAQQTSLVSQGVGLVQSLLGLAANNKFGSAPRAPTVTYDPGPLYRPPGYTPGYTPDTSGESAAQEYFYANPDQFIATPPTTYTYNDGYDPDAGWLDQR